MILILSCIVYSLLVLKLRLTPVFYFTITFNRYIFSPIVYAIKKLFTRKTASVVIEDAFDIPVKDNKASTLAEKLADKGGDDIAKITTEIGKMFVDVDMRVKVFFGFLITVFFVTGIVVHVRWAIMYWEASLIFISLFIEFVTWTKKTATPKTQPNV